MKCVQMSEKYAVRICFAHTPVSYNGSLSAVNETNCNKKKKEVTSSKFIMNSSNFWTCPSKNRLRKSAISCIAAEILVLQFHHLIHDEDGFLRETAAPKSCRSRVGAFLPDLFNLRYHCPWYLLSFSLEMVRVILLCQFVHLYALLLVPANFELGFTIDLVSEKAIVNTCKISTLRVNFLAASLPRIPGFLILFLFFSFAVSNTMATPFLDHG